LHHWHHDRERDRGNYANISPLMDLLFGTYVCPGKEPEELGLKEEFSKNYLGQMIRPMVPDFLWKKFGRRENPKRKPILQASTVDT